MFFTFYLRFVMKSYSLEISNYYCQRDNRIINTSFYYVPTYLFSWCKLKFIFSTSCCSGHYIMSLFWCKLHTTRWLTAALPLISIGSSLNESMSSFKVIFIGDNDTIWFQGTYNVLVWGLNGLRWNCSVTASPPLTITSNLSACNGQRQRL